MSDFPLNTEQVVRLTAALLLEITHPTGAGGDQPGLFAAPDGSALPPADFYDRPAKAA